MGILPVANRLLTREKKVALTFDDGPNPYFTPAILDVLKSESCTATFFVIGRWAEQHPELLRRIANEGHIVGGHTYFHGGDRGRDPYHEFKKGNEVIERILGEPVRYIRVPQVQYAKVDAGIPRSIELFETDLQSKIQRGQVTVVGGSVATLDWLRGVPSAFNKWIALRLLHPGAIIALHDGCEREKDLRTRPKGTLQMLPDFIRSVRERGYEFVSLRDPLLFQGKKIQLTR